MDRLDDDLPAMRRLGANPALVAAPALGGLVGAHALAYRLAGTTDRVDHGYLAYAPLALTLLATLALAALGAAALDGRRSGRVRAWPFAALPPLAFALQEHLERLLPTGAWPTHLLGERVFLLGLALQLPFALAAWLLARGLAAAAGAVGAALARRRPRPRPRVAAPRAPRSASVRATPRARARPIRGPPLASVG